MNRKTIVREHEILRSKLATIETREELLRQKEAEIALKEQQAFTENLVQYSSIPTFVIDTTHKVIFWNRACEQLTNVPAREMVGTDNHYRPFYQSRRPLLADLIIDGIPEAVASHYTRYEKSSLSENALTAEDWFPNLGGSEKYLIFDAAPIYNSKGELIAAIETLRDITKRKKMEESLEYRLSLEKIIASISTSFINLSSEDCNPEINSVLEKMGEFCGVDRVYLFLLSDNRRQMNNTHEWCRDGIEPQREHLQNLELADFPWLSKYLENLEVVTIARVTVLPDEAAYEKEHFEMQGIQSLLLVPMSWKRSLVGFLGFDSVHSEKSWAAEDISLLKIIGEIFVNAFERIRIESEQETLILELKAALSKVKTLSGFLPICASCKKIRDDKGYWNQIEEYIRDHSEADFSHSLCPDCIIKLYPELS